MVVIPPVSTAASSEVLELREKFASLQVLLNKSVYGMYKIMEKVERVRENFSDRSLYCRV